MAIIPDSGQRQAPQTGTPAVGGRGGEAAYKEAVNSLRSTMARFVDDTMQGVRNPMNAQTEIGREGIAANNAAVAFDRAARAVGATYLGKLKGLMTKTTENAKAFDQLRDVVADNVVVAKKFGAEVNKVTAGPLAQMAKQEAAAYRDFTKGRHTRGALGIAGEVNQAVEERKARRERNDAISKLELTRTLYKGGYGAIAAAGMATEVLTTKQEKRKQAELEGIRKERYDMEITREKQNLKKSNILKRLTLSPFETVRQMKAARRTAMMHGGGDGGPGGFSSQAGAVLGSAMPLVGAAAGVVGGFMLNKFKQGYAMKTGIEQTFRGFGALNTPGILENYRGAAELGYSPQEAAQLRYGAARAQYASPGRASELRPLQTSMAYGVDPGSAISLLGNIARTGQGMEALRSSPKGQGNTEQNNKRLEKIFKLGLVSGFKDIEMDDYISNVNNMVTQQQQMTLGAGDPAFMAGLIGVTAKRTGKSAAQAAQIQGGMQQMFLGQINDPTFLRMAGGFGQNRGYLESRDLVWSAMMGDKKGESVAARKEMFSRFRKSARDSPREFQMMVSQFSGGNVALEREISDAVMGGGGDADALAEAMKKANETPLSIQKSMDKSLSNLVTASLTQDNILLATKDTANAMNVVKTLLVRKWGDTLRHDLGGAEIQYDFSNIEAKNLKDIPKAKREAYFAEAAGVLKAVRDLESDDTFTLEDQKRAKREMLKSKGLLDKSVQRGARLETASVLRVGETEKELSEAITKLNEILVRKTVINVVVDPNEKKGEANTNVDGE